MIKKMNLKWTNTTVSLEKECSVLENRLFLQANAIKSSKVIGIGGNEGIQKFGNGDFCKAYKINT